MMVGDELAPLAVGEITKAQIAEYSRVSADPNPMHTDEELAREMGYPTVYAQGMLGMAFLSRFVVARAGGIGKLRRIKVRFHWDPRPQRAPRKRTRRPPRCGRPRSARPPRAITPASYLRGDFA